MENSASIQYDEDSIKSLDWKEHIRLRPGMYIGKLGDGSSIDDGIYVLVKEIVDNSIDEHMMGNGKNIEIKISEHRVEVRDYGRGIPLGKVVDCVSKINTGGKYDSGAFQKSVGLNGVGTKAVNALSNYFKVQSFREGKSKNAEFQQGNLVNESGEITTSQRNGTHIAFEPDGLIFKNFTNPQFIAAEFATLFTVGLILGAARLRTGALWFSIGLHAGWIFAFKGFNLLHKSIDSPLRPLWIGDSLRSGLLPLLTLFLTAVICHYILRSTKSSNSPLNQ